MTWLSLLIVVGALVAIIAVGGVRPRGARPVARTGLMAAGRIVLLILVAVIAYAAWVR